jgi:hypothetical protein
VRATILTTAAILLVSAGLCLAGDDVTAGELTVEPATLICLGFEWEIAGDDNFNATCKVEYRRKGQGAWTTSLPLHRTYYKMDDNPQLLAGSIFNLAPGTTYEVRLTMSDPDGAAGKTTRQMTLTTRATPTMPAGGTTWHVYPDGFQGDKAGPSIGSLRETLCSKAAAGRIKPGDTILLHGGTYAMDHQLGGDRSVGETTVNLGTPPKMPAKPNVRHVYPAGYKGKKLEPSYTGIGYALRGKKRAFGSSDGLAGPGTVLMVHGGVYKHNRYDYRNKLGGANGEGVWRPGAHGGLTTCEGSAENPIVIKAAGDGEPIFDGADCFNLFDLRDTKHLWIDGLTVRDTDVAFYTGRADMPGSQAEGLAITNCTVRDVEVPVWVNGETPEGFDAGWHGTLLVKLKGTAKRPIVLKPAGDGEVIIDGKGGFCLMNLEAADHLWLHRLTLRRADGAILAGGNLRGGPGFDRCDGLIVTRCRIEDVRYGIVCTSPDATGYYIADNRIIGRMTGRYSISNYAAPFGVSLGGRGHVACFNHIEAFHDALDTAWTRVDSRKAGRYTAAVDFYNNDLFYHGDDFVEADAGTMNIRILRNRCYNCLAVALSNQGVSAGPYYWIRNVAVNTSSGRAAFKNPGGVVGVVAYHNTIMAHNAMNLSMSCSDYRNNIFLGWVQSGRRAGKHSVLQVHGYPHNTHDYNAHRATPSAGPKPWVVARGEGKGSYATFDDFVQASGFETHGMIVPGVEIFRRCPDVDAREGMHPYKNNKVYLPEDFDLRLSEGAAPIDAGCSLPGINDDHTGNAPDLGAYEIGKPIPHYGPRVLATERN